eukprot:jgi/Botrbrau1/13458/Bobra.0082s0060.2
MASYYNPSFQYPAPSAPPLPAGAPGFAASPASAGPRPQGYPQTEAPQANFYGTSVPQAAQPSVYPSTPAPAYYYPAPPPYPSPYPTMLQQPAPVVVQQAPPQTGIFGGGSLLPLLAGGAAGLLLGEALSDHYSFGGGWGNDDVTIINNYDDVW